MLNARVTSYLLVADEELMEVELDISVKGMMCDGCSSRVEEVLSKEKGVSRVEVRAEVSAQDAYTCTA